MADDLLEVTGDLAGERQQVVGILLQLASESSDPGLRGWRLLSALDLAEVRRLDSDACCDLTEGVGSIGLPEVFAPLSDVAPERGHS